MRKPASTQEDEEEEEQEETNIPAGKQEKTKTAIVKRAIRARKQEKDEVSWDLDASAVGIHFLKEVAAEVLASAKVEKEDDLQEELTKVLKGKNKAWTIPATKLERSLPMPSQQNPNRRGEFDILITGPVSCLLELKYIPGAFVVGGVPTNEEELLKRRFWHMVHVPEGLIPLVMGNDRDRAPTKAEQEDILLRIHVSGQQFLDLREGKRAPDYDKPGKKFPTYHGEKQIAMRYTTRVRDAGRSAWMQAADYARSLAVHKKASIFSVGIVIGVGSQAIVRLAAFSDVLQGIPEL